MSISLYASSRVMFHRQLEFACTTGRKALRQRPADERMADSYIYTNWTAKLSKSFLSYHCKQQMPKEMTRQNRSQPAATGSTRLTRRAAALNADTHGWIAKQEQDRQDNAYPTSSTREAKGASKKKGKKAINDNASQHGTIDDSEAAAEEAEAGTDVRHPLDVQEEEEERHSDRISSGPGSSSDDSDLSDPPEVDKSPEPSTRHTPERPAQQTPEPATRQAPEHPIQPNPFRHTLSSTSLAAPEASNADAKSAKKRPYEQDLDLEADWNEPTPKSPRKANRDRHGGYEASNRLGRLGSPSPGLAIDPESEGGNVRGNDQEDGQGEGQGEERGYGLEGQGDGPRETRRETQRDDRENAEMVSATALPRTSLS